MWENAGKKLKSAAVVIFWVDIVLYAILALVALGESLLVFLVLLILGPVVSYVSTLGTLALCELVENSRLIKDAALYWKYYAEKDRKESEH